ncbi:hypothetical protein [uncultured Serinicoccus sp.]|uniref:hypothetical protein n=1 Tax=uncultured Serinicoccus sp. TaxID=735514 RepID=UPI0026299E5E|nr:hypothetical protein [uncultured Serinicoccus sp.]
MLGLDHARVLRWQIRAGQDQLADARPGPAQALHGLLDWEREAILALAEAWGPTDRSHRKLAHRGSRLGAFYAAESTVLRVLRAADCTFPGYRHGPRVRNGPGRARPNWCPG